MRRGKVFIAEGFEPWPHHDALVHDHQTFREGPEDVSVEEAIAWGQSQADVVWVRVGYGDLGGDEGYFSAGIRHPDPATPIWPEHGIEVTERPYDGPWRAG